MSSIGLIFKADNEITELLPDWVVSPLETRNEVLAAIKKWLLWVTNLTASEQR
jgi:hypothetical protein